MKVFFIRHGEAIDDVENKYGGWYDPDLSPKGLAGAKMVGEKLKVINTSATLILSSPLKRTVQTATEIAKVLNLPIETFIYLKERNTYGLLCGENKDEAKQKYPDLVTAYETGQEVLGYENYDFFLKRIKALLEKLRQRKEQIVICVTHGKLLAAFFKDVLHQEAKNFGDNCLAEVEIDSQGSLSLKSTDGIEFA